MRRINTADPIDLQERELLAESLDQPRSKTAIFRELDCRTILLGPCQARVLCHLIGSLGIRNLGVQRPSDLNVASRYRQSAELRGVGAELVERHRDGNHGA